MLWNGKPCSICGIYTVFKQLIYCWFVEYNIANSSWHFNTNFSLWTGRSPPKCYMDLGFASVYIMFGVNQTVDNLSYDHQNYLLNILNNTLSKLRSYFSEDILTARLLMLQSNFRGDKQKSQLVPCPKASNVRAEIQKAENNKNMLKAWCSHLPSYRNKRPVPITC